MGKIEELLVNKGLYDSVDITVDDLDEIEKCLTKDEYAGNTIDCFCVHCATNRAMTYRCTRDRQHFIIFDLITTDDKIIKVGQYPSVADLVIPEIAKYKPVLGTQYREFSKAIGLFAHGIGIGSFVYLRRIIENLVFDKYNEVSENLEISNTEFMRLKFDEKIEALKPYLPEVLVANKNIYGIVSKGIHELSEEECREMFPYIKAGIELILDSLLAEKERKSKEKIFEKFVAKKTGELK